MTPEAAPAVLPLKLNSYGRQCYDSGYESAKTEAEAQREGAQLKDRNELAAKIAELAREAERGGGYWTAIMDVLQIVGTKESR